METTKRKALEERNRFPISEVEEETEVEGEKRENMNQQQQSKTIEKTEKLKATKIAPIVIPKRNSGWKPAARYYKYNIE